MKQPARRRASRPAQRRPGASGLVLLGSLAGLLLTACGGGAGGGGNDGEFVTREGIVVTGIADDGTPTSPIVGGTCQAVDGNGLVLDSATTGADGGFLLLVNPGQLVSVVCADAGQSRLALRTFVSTIGLAAGGELPGQDVLPSTTVIARIVAREAADDPSLDVGSRVAALRASITPTDGSAPDADLLLLADAATLAYDRFRETGEDLDLDALLEDLFDDGDLDFFADAAAAASVESGVAALASAAGRTLPSAVLATHPSFDFTILNVSGGGSALTDVGRFATVLADARSTAPAAATLTLASGEVLASGLELVASLENQDPFPDAVAVDTLGFDAIGLGVSDLELGPPVFGILMDRIEGDTVVVATDVDVSVEGNAFFPVDGAQLASSLVLDRAARAVGIVGATPLALADASSTRSITTFDADIRSARLQTAIDAALGAGARVVVLMASITDGDELAALLAALSGVDVVVLTPPGAAGTATGASEAIALATLTGADGRDVPVVTGVAGYEGLVRADLRADPLGRIDTSATVATRLRTLSDTTPDADVVAAVETPLATAIDALRAETVAQTEVELDTSAETLFSTNSNWGDLLADAVLFGSRSQGQTFGSVTASAAFVDAGAGDSATPIEAGASIDRASLYGELLETGRVVGVLQQVTPADLKRLLEFSFANRGEPLFAQIGGLEVTFDADGTAQILADDGNVAVPGTRIRRVRIGDNDIVTDGVAVEGGPTIAIAITEGVRDAYPLGDLQIINVGVSFAQIVDGFIRLTLNGSIQNDNFPVGGNGRLIDAGG